MIKQTQTCGQLAFAASKLLMVPLVNIQDTTDNSRKASEARYMVYGLMESAGYTHLQIAEYFNMHRESVTKALSNLDVLVATYQDIKDSYSRLHILALK